MLGWPAVDEDNKPCCPTIGFDETAWSWVTGCLTGYPVVANLKTNIARLDECQLIFAGNNGVCGNAIRFSGGDLTALGNWVASGGRLFIAGEHSGNGPGFTGFIFKCLFDMPNLNSFLSGIGSTLQYVGFDYNQVTPSCSPTYYSAGAANIASGITFTGERFGEVSGGTSLWIGNAGTGGSGSGLGKVAAAIEAIGNGFVVVTGDGNHGYCSGYCDFLMRFITYHNSDVI